MKKIFLFATALLMSASMFAKTSVITYTATEKLEETTSEGSTGLYLNAFYAADSTQLTVTHTFDQGVGTITLDGEVAIIGYRAFNRTILTSVTLPESVTTIGNQAFNNCDSLLSVTLSEGLTTIGEDAFYACDTLQSVTIPASVTTIESGAFMYCSGLISVTFLSNACQNAIGECAFLGVGEETPVLLTLPDNWTGTKPDKEGNWYDGKFKLNDTALPQMRAAVKATKVMTNGQVIFRKENKNFSVLGQEIR